MSQLRDFLDFRGSTDFYHPLLRAIFFFLIIHFPCVQSHITVPITSGTLCRSVPEYDDGTTTLPQCFPMSIPSTCLSTLISNRVFDSMMELPFSHNSSDVMVDASEILYYKDNMGRIPDVTDLGRAYYSFWYNLNFPRSPLEGGLNSSVLGSDRSRRFVHLGGIGYVGEVYHGGTLVSSSAGLFSRLVVDLTRGELTSPLRIWIEPPFHPGETSSACAVREDCSGQGGDHLLAGDAGSMQFTAGWDWIHSVPDRNTGIWGEVSAVFLRDAVSVRDCVVWTRDIIKTASDGGDGGEVSAVLEARSTLKNHGDVAVSGIWRLELKDRMNGQTVLRSTVPVDLAGNQTKIIRRPDLKLKDARLWWPHTMGEPHLYLATVSFIVNDIDSDIDNNRKEKEKEKSVVSDYETFHVGIRTIHSHIHPNTGGRAFEINSVPIFLQGGNWIATDAILSIKKDRYHNEIRLHVYAGLNFLRVWGGGIAERPAFYDACDELGVLVLQEFWMTGDNNGRWGGDYSYPRNAESFLTQAADVVQSLRAHPSLMFWCGGNELWPKTKSPRPTIRSGMERLMKELDPHRFFIWSSMDGGLDGGDMTQHDPDYALAPKDGPYHFLEPSIYFRDNNPGIHSPNIKDPRDLIVSFQPEIGASGMPRYESMLRLGLVDAKTNSSFPSYEDDDVPSLWEFHNFQGYAVRGATSHHNHTSVILYNAVYQYGTPKTAEEYIAHAQLACYQQYKSLTEGFTSKMFSPSTRGGKAGFVIWKTQSPWPSLRGFLYDWFLESTGSLEGVRAATGGGQNQLHTQFNLHTMTVEMVHRGAADLIVAPASIVTLEIFDLEGISQHVQHFGYPGNRNATTILRASSVVTMEGEMMWPPQVSRVSFVRIRSALHGVDDNWYWMRYANGQHSNDYSDLGRWRDGTLGIRVEPNVTLEAVRESAIDLRISSNKGVLFYPMFTARLESMERILPLFVEGAPLVLLEEEEIVVTLTVGKQYLITDVKQVEVEFWAGGMVTVEVGRMEKVALSDAVDSLSRIKH